MDLLPQSHQTSLTIASLLILSYLLWRVWKFTVMPWLYPHDPKELPYWFPVIGHASAFFNNSNVLLSRAREQFGNTREPFALTLAGAKMYVITKPKDVATAYRNTETLTFDEFVQAWMRSLGNTEFCVKAFYRPLPVDKEGFPNPHGKPLAILTRQMHLHHLYPGERLIVLQREIGNWFEKNLHMNVFPKDCSYAVGSGSGVVVPLMEWCSDYFTRSVQNAYYGEALDGISPTLAKTFKTYDDLSWQVLYRYPDFLARDMKSARDTIVRTFKQYLQLPQSQKRDDGFIRALEDEMRALDINEDDIATVFFIIYWGANTNTRRVAFWLLAYLLNTPSLIEVVRKETQSAFEQDEIDLNHIHNNCPQLEAMWNETIRLSAYAGSVRGISRDTIIGGKILRKGNRLIIPYRQLHFDETVFGDGIEDFRPDRFFEKKNLTRTSNWRPFGGGSTMCPGRHFAKRAVFTFVAIVLHRFDIKMEGKLHVPEPEESTPTLGIMLMKNGEDVNVRLTPRRMEDGEKVKG